MSGSAAVSAAEPITIHGAIAPNQAAGISRSSPAPTAPPRKAGTQSAFQPLCPSMRRR
jgi:hypothetical protein